MRLALHWSSAPEPSLRSLYHRLSELDVLIVDPIITKLLHQRQLLGKQSQINLQLGKKKKNFRASLVKLKSEAGSFLSPIFSFLHIWFRFLLYTYCSHTFLQTNYAMTARQSTPASEHSHSDSGVRKRVCKACDRCRLKKSKVSKQASVQHQHPLMR